MLAVILGALGIAGTAAVAKRVIVAFERRAITKMKSQQFGDGKPVNFTIGQQQFTLPSFGKVEEKFTGPFEEKSTMSLTEASNILGIESPFYTAEQVREKHRLLIKRQHPDSGGSLFVATKINQAKDVLVKHLNTSSAKST